MNFDSTYQSELLVKLTSKPFLQRVAGRISPEMFDPPLDDVAKKLLHDWQSRKAVMSYGQLKQLAYQAGSKLTRSEGGDESFDLEAIERFAWYRSFRRKTAQALIAAEKGNLDEAERLVAQRGLAGLNGKEPPNRLVESPKHFDRRKIVSTGIPTLDETFKGGVSAGELAVVMAITGGGKSSFLSYLAGVALKAGLNVYYVTLEVPERDIYVKVRATLTGQEDASGPVWKKATRKLRKWWLEAYEPHSISVRKLAQAIPEAADLVLVDYADYLIPSSGEGGLDYTSLGSIYTELKGLAMQRGIPIWTATQVNREGYEDDDKPEKFQKKKGALLMLHHIEASMKKAFISDQIISINQQGVEEIPDEKSGNCTGTIFVAKNRIGKRYVKVPVTINWALCGFKEGRWT